jgi:HK97 family phage major capsid protein
MSSARRALLEEEKQSFLKAAREIAAKAESENRDFTPEERTAVQTSVESARKSHQSILELDGDAKLLDDINVLGAPVGELAKGAQRVTSRKSVGSQFTEDARFREWMKSVAPTGTIPESSKGLNSPAVAFDSKALITGVSDTSAGAIVQNDQIGLQVGLDLFQRPLTIRDVITNGQTDSDTIEYSRVTAITNNAAPTPEATSSATPGLGGVAVGAYTTAHGVKPESSMTLEKVSTTVKTIAHWLPATKRALSDAGQIRTLIDNFLRYGLEEELEDQIVSGAGTGENFEGILTVSGTQTQAWDTNLLVTTRKAKTKVRTVGRSRANAFLLSPEDNERIDLLRDDSGGAGTGSFLFGSPAGNQVQTLWGLVGDFRKAVLWDREQAAVQVSDSHNDFFVRNLVAILAEMRAGFGVVQPSAFVEIDLTA